jgi:hypothetical protein
LAVSSAACDDLGVIDDSTCPISAEPIGRCATSMPPTRKADQGISGRRIVSCRPGRSDAEGAVEGDLGVVARRGDRPNDGAAVVAGRFEEALVQLTGEASARR